MADDILGKKRIIVSFYCELHEVELLPPAMDAHLKINMCDEKFIKMRKVTVYQGYVYEER